MVHTRSTRTLAFTQPSSFHKLSVPPIYVTPAWRVFSKPCTKRTLHCNHRSGHLKTEHRKPFPAATPSCKLAPRARSKYEKGTAGSAWETWTVAAADGVRCARVSWEINFLLTFETAPFFCVYPVYGFHIFKSTIASFKNMTPMNYAAYQYVRFITIIFYIISYRYQSHL